MATPDDILTAQRQIVANLEIAAAELNLKVEKERAILRGMEIYAEAVGSAQPRRTASARTGPENREKRVGGRQPGSISKRWRVILTSLQTYFEWFNAEEVIRAVKHHEGRDMKPSEVKRLFEGYVKYGFLDQNAAGDYRVTDIAIKKFGLEPKQSSASDAPDENEAPNGEAVGASETRGWDAPPPLPPTTTPSSWPRA